MPDPTPAAVEAAQEHGVDPATVPGTGKDDRVTKADVDAVVADTVAPEDKPNHPDPVTLGAEDEFDVKPGDDPPSAPHVEPAPADPYAGFEPVFANPEAADDVPPAAIGTYPNPIPAEDDPRRPAAQAEYDATREAQTPPEPEPEYVRQARDVEDIARRTNHPSAYREDDKAE